MTRARRRRQGSHPVSRDLLTVDPGELASAASAIALTRDEGALLAPDHPFLAYGTWRGFALAAPEGPIARVVASIDPRQRSSAGAVGCIGFVRLDPDVSRNGSAWASAVAVVTAAAQWLAASGVAVIRAPVQLSTWYGHRAVTDSFPAEGGAPPFPLEPRTDRQLVDLLVATGFEPVHRAVSYAVRSDDVLASGDPIVARLFRIGWHDRALQLEALDDELRLLHGLSREIFAGSWASSDMSFDEFAALYRPLAKIVDPELVRIALDGDERPIGFAFLIPAGARPAGSTFVLKTLGIVPNARRSVGAGVALAAIAHRAAVARGYRDGVHALMTEGSMAHRTSMRWGSRIRSYATFERALR